MRHLTPRYRPALTFIELIIVITIMAILSLAVALAFPRLQAQLTFDQTSAQIQSLFADARTKGLQEQMMENASTVGVDHYELVFSSTALTLNAVGEDASTENINAVDLPKNYTLSDEFTLYFFPPKGDICVDEADYPACTNASSSSYQVEKLVVLEDAAHELRTQFTFSVLGRTVTVENL